MDIRTYYDAPVLQDPVWKADIAWYLFTGGLAGGSSILAAAGDLAGDAAVARTARLAALGGIGVSPYFLIKDLGVPKRFPNMLRVFRPTSPMNVGSWLLAGYGPLVGLAAISDVTGLLPRLGRVAGLGAGVLGAGVATYTAVLVADTAVPAWHEARYELPFVFASGAAASAGGVATAVLPPRSARLPRRLGLLGSVAEVVAAELMNRRLGDLARPYHEGRAAAFRRASGALGLAGSGLVAVAGRRRRWASVLGGAAMVAGAACERFAVLEAGRQSARDPRATVGPQRERLGGSTASGWSEQAALPPSATPS
jgi:formate-dependent nitrite reductase membrane component NrfD